MSKETIFDHNVTDQEIKELFNEHTGCKTVAEYKERLKRTKFYSGFSGDFNRLVELEELFKFRGDFEKAKHYGELAEKTEFMKCYNSHSHRT